MEAQALFRQGVLAIRDEKNVERGRQLLTESLQMDPDNDMAWLWLTHTVTDAQQRLEYVERALALNPENQHALTLKNQLLARLPTVPDEPARPAIQPLPKTLSAADKERIEALLDRAEIYMEAGEAESAVAQWVEVLKLQVDHEVALSKAVKQLWRMNYIEDAKDLIWRALKSGTTVPTIYLTAIDMAEREHDYAKADALRAYILKLPGAEDTLFVKVADQYVAKYKTEEALHYLQAALQVYPGNQKLLVRLGDLNQEIGRSQEAMRYYDEAARLKPGSKVGKEADKKLLEYVPILTDRERGSLWLAVREVGGIGLFFLFLGWQDAGLNLFQMGLLRWAGVLVSLLGGYWLVTATSSPQQRLIAARLGGIVPDGEPGADEEATQLPIIPESLRYFLGFLGVALLLIAFFFVSQRALHLIVDYSSPSIPHFDFE
jgi:tetratricopeptide (TPR) repeat protein